MGDYDKKIKTLKDKFTKNVHSMEETFNKKISELTENITDGESLYSEYSDMFKNKVKILNKSSNQLPKFETIGSAGFDFRANEELIIKPMERVLVSTGLFFEFGENLELGVRPRSGLAIKHGITVLNSPGTVDSDYRGEVKVMLINLGQEDFKIEVGDRIAQGVFSNVVSEKQIKFENVEGINENTERGSGGFGSTGVK